MHRERLAWLRLGAVALDAAVLTATWVTVVALRSVAADSAHALTPLEPALAWPLGWVIVPWWLLALAWRGAYQAMRRKTAQRLLAEIVAATLVAAVVATALVFLARLPLNRTLLVGFAIASIPALGISRALQAVALRALRLRHFDPYRVVVIGPPEAARPLLEGIAAHAEWGIEVHAHLPKHAVHTLGDLLVAQPIDEVFAVGGLQSDHLDAVARVTDELGVPLSVDATFLGLRAGRVDLQEVGGWTAVTFRTAGPTLERVAKRALDLTVASVALVCTAPLLMLLALWVWASDGHSPWFSQQRVGQFGRPFRMLKLRTMVPDAEAQQRALLADNDVDGPVFKLDHDPRVTRLGRRLRRLSLDELPQLINVLRGDMSLVGPRPPLPPEVARYERWQLRRLSVRPGMTGLWQVSGRSDLPFAAGLDLDLQYIDRWSLWLDLSVLARTVPAVLRGTGAR